MSTSTRRAFLTGATTLLAAPAIVRAGSLMPVFTPKPIFYVPFETPWLDNWGVLWSLPRLVGEIDANYRQRLLRKLEVT